MQGSDARTGDDNNKPVRVERVGDVNQPDTTSRAPAREKPRPSDRPEFGVCVASLSIGHGADPRYTASGERSWPSALITCRRRRGPVDPFLPTNGSSQMGTHRDCYTRGSGCDSHSAVDRIVQRPLSIGGPAQTETVARHLLVRR
jgi:hypothetical protein